MEKVKKKEKSDWRNSSRKTGNYIVELMENFNSFPSKQRDGFGKRETIGDKCSRVGKKEKVKEVQQRIWSYVEMLKTNQHRYD